MTIALVVLDSTDREALLRWAGLIASARGQDLFVLEVATEREGDAVSAVDPHGDPPDPLVTAASPLLESGFVWSVDRPTPEEAGEAGSPPTGPTADASGEQEAAPLAVELARAPGADPEMILHAVRKSGAELLVLPRSRHAKGTDERLQLQRRLFRDASCAVLLLRPAEDSGRTCRSIVVGAGAGKPSAAALALAAELAQRGEGRATAVYVIQDVDPFARQAGQNIVDRIVTRAVGKPAERMDTRVVLAHDVLSGLREAVRDEDDLLLLGAVHHGVVHRFLFSSLSEKLLASEIAPTVGIYRPPMPWASRLQKTTERLLEYRVPQLDRERRVSLVERVRSSSRWDFDFISLTCLSTLIATLGLIQDSAAVVIGAMLVAPLMTPLLGAGLSLVQGNVRLLRNAVGAVVRGFLVALLIAWLTGQVVPDMEVTAEMLARGQPRILDLVVAFCSGVAAAYAMGRPHLVSALPGVAIAAALVPPIGTMGLCLAVGSWGTAIGAALLFATNIVAIVLGAAVSLWAVGIRGSHEHGGLASWPWRVALALVVVAVGLGVYQVLARVTVGAGARQLVEHRLSAEHDASLIGLRTTGAPGARRVDVIVGSPRSLSVAEMRDLVALVREAGYDHVQVRLEVRRVYSSGPEEG